MECETTEEMKSGSGCSSAKIKSKNGNCRQMMMSRSNNCGNSRCNQNGVVQPLLTGKERGVESVTLR